MTISGRDDKVWELLLALSNGAKVRDLVSSLGMSTKTMYNAINSCPQLKKNWCIARSLGNQQRKRSISEGTAGNRRKGKRKRGKVRFCAICGNPTINRRYMITDRTYAKKERFYFCSYAHLKEWSIFATVDASKQGRKLYQILDLSERVWVCPALSSFVLTGCASYAARAVNDIRGSCPSHPIIDRYDKALTFEKGRVCSLPYGWIYDVIKAYDGSRPMIALIREHGGTEHKFYYWVNKSKEKEADLWIWESYQIKKKK